MSTTSPQALADATEATAIPSGVEVIYAFGSARYGESDPADIDLLVVYSSGLEREAAGQIGAPIREALQGHLDTPVHLLLLSLEEVSQVGFVESEDALQVWPAPLGGEVAATI